MIINEWPVEFTAKYGHHWPSSYLAFDTEYCGSNEREDLIMEIGHVMVEDGVVVDKLNVVLNWYSHPEIQHSLLDYKLNNMRNYVGPGWVLLPDAVKENGIDPIKALRFYQKLFAAWNKRGLPFVAQNGQAADERMLRGNFNRFINYPFELPPNGYFDTGAIFKATQVWNATEGDAVNHRQMMLPHRSETLKQYFHRIIHTRLSGIKWNIDCILDHYKLNDKHEVSSEQRHTAGFDAECLHWIMEEYSSRVTKSNLPENPFESSHSMQRAFDQEQAKHKLANEKAAKTKAEASAKLKPPEAPSTGQLERTKPGLSQQRRRRRRQRRV
jgi:hypothetical protein